MCPLREGHVLLMRPRSLQDGLQQAVRRYLHQHALVRDSGQLLLEQYRVQEVVGLVLGRAVLRGVGALQAQPQAQVAVIC